MKKFIYTVMFIGIFYAKAYNQYNYFDVHYTGSQSLTSFTIEDSWLITKTSGSWASDGTILTMQVPSFYIRDLQHNLLFFWNKQITTSSSKIHISDEETVFDDYGNFLTKFNITIDPGYTADLFRVFIETRLDNQIDLDVFNPQDQYPLSGVPLSVSQLYLEASTLIDWHNSGITSRANQLANGCTSEFQIVQKVAEWVKANIAYVTNQSEVASSVLVNGGDCDGQSNLVIALLRSLAIPARIASGYSFDIEFQLPLWPPLGNAVFNQGATGYGNAAGHACYEVYYPSISPHWVPGDPAQSSSNYTHISNLFIGHGPDVNWFTANSFLRHPTNIGLTLQQELPLVNSSLTNLSTNFHYQYNNTFTGSKNTTQNRLYNTSDVDIATGLYDEVLIGNPLSGTISSYGTVPNNTYLITQNVGMSFFSFFESGSTPLTHPTSFNWSVKALCNGSNYTFQQGTSIVNCIRNGQVIEGSHWFPIAGSLPINDYIYDSDNNVYGQIEVTANISDGTSTTDIADIAIACQNSNITNTVFTSNKFIHTCGDVLLQNVTVQNSSSLVVRCPGIANITGPIDIQTGSSFEIK